MNRYKKRRTIVSALVITLILTGIASYSLFSDANANGERRLLEWQDEIETVYVPLDGGVWYPRMLELDNGDWLISFDTNEDVEDVEVNIVRSTDQGETWSEPVTAVHLPGRDVANGQMMQLENGDIWLAYRVVNQGELGTYETELNVHVSTDNGESWTPLENGLIDTDAADDFKGVWEPHLEFLGDQIAVMYAHDGPSEVGYTPYQNVLMKIWEENGWSEKIVVADGVEHESRDGMPVWMQMSNGEYIVTYEASNIEGYPFVIKYTISPDGLDWSGERQRLFTPDIEEKKAGAPYIVTMNDGTLVASFQTDESSFNTGDPYTSMKTLTSLDDGATWGDLHHTFPVPDDSEANWNSMMSTENGELIAVTSSNHPEVGIYIRRASQVAD